MHTSRLQNLPPLSRKPNSPKIFPNEAFGFWRPRFEMAVAFASSTCRRLPVPIPQDCKDAVKSRGQPRDTVAIRRLGPGPHLDLQPRARRFKGDADQSTTSSCPPKRLKLLQMGLAQNDESAKPVIRKVHKPGKAKPAPLWGCYESRRKEARVGRVRTGHRLARSEQVPLLENGGIEASSIAKCCHTCPMPGSTNRRQGSVRNLVHRHF